MKQILFVITILILMVSVGYGSEINKISLSKLDELSDYIVLGQVQSIVKDGNIDTATIKADSFIKGSSPQDIFTFTLVTRGGLKDFDPELKKGDTGVFFLKTKKLKGEVEKAYWGSVAIFPKNNFKVIESQPLQSTIKSDEGVYEMEKESVSKDEALRVAEEICSKEGWEWVDVDIRDRNNYWEIQTHFHRLGGNAFIRIDKNTGKILNKHYTGP